MSTAFSKLGLNQELCEALARNGISEPTPVQREAIPLLLRSGDTIAQAQTGTGKTLAFALPILQRIRTDRDQVQALILTPTRELALQITNELGKLAPAVGANVLAAYGGQDVEAQVRKLKRAPHVIVATPGRLIDHLSRGNVRLGQLDMLVLDEADQMLHMGFLPEVEHIIAQTPSSRQTMLFSATMPDAVRRLAAKYMNDPADVTIRSERVTLDAIEQWVIETTDRGRQRALIHLLERHRPYLAVVFCRTKIRAKKLNDALQEAGIESDELHGDLTQAKREQVMKRFRAARLQVLVATDVAARGLDVEGVTHVYNYDVPQDAELYIHRIGRTGRAGESGMAVTLASPADRQAVAAIERGIGQRIRVFAIDREGALTEEGGGKKAAGRDAGSRNGQRNRSERAGFGRGPSGPSGRSGRSGRSGGGNAGNSRSNRGPQERAGRGKGAAVSESGNPWEAESFAARAPEDRPAHGRTGRQPGRKHDQGNAGGPRSGKGRTGGGPSGSGKSAGGGRSGGRSGGGRSGGRNASGNRSKSRGR